MRRILSVPFLRVRNLASLLVLDDIGRVIGAVWVPLELQGNNPAGDVSVGTVTTAHSPVGRYDLRTTGE
jgi:hypothetical protein